MEQEMNERTTKIDNSQSMMLENQTEFKEIVVDNLNQKLKDNLNEEL